MQNSIVEKVRKDRRLKSYSASDTNKTDKMRRRNQRLHRAIKEGEYNTEIE